MATTKPADKGEALIAALERHLTKLMHDTMRDPEASLNDKTKVADRVLQLVKIKAQLDDGEEGSGFSSADD